MATRFYCPETEAAAVSPTISADWEHQNVLRRRALTTPDGSALTTTAYTPDAADHLVDQDAHHRQYVTDPLAAQTIAAQTFKAVFQCLEANAANNLFLTVKVFVCSQDGLTIKETLLAITRDGTECATALTNRAFSATTTVATIEDGDRVVVELGLGGLPTAAGGTQGHNGSIRWGCNASGGDLAENDTETGTTFRGWFEFANTLTFQTAASSPVVPVRTPSYRGFEAEGFDYGRNVSRFGEVRRVEPPVPASPVVPWGRGQLMEQEVEPVHVFPRFYPVVPYIAPPPPANPIIPYVQAESRWWSDPQAQSYPYNQAEDAFFYPLITYAILVEQYECRFQFDPTKFNVLNIYFEADLKGGTVRLWNETDGVMVTGSELTNAGGTYSRMRTGHLSAIPGSAKTYRCEVIVPPGGQVSVRGARLILETV